METRNSDSRPRKAKASPLPVDYLEMVSEIFGKNFDGLLKEVTKLKTGKPSFYVSGGIFLNEVILAVTLSHEGQITATTVHASADFDPKASSPTAEDLLSACVDAIGVVFTELSEQAAGLADESLSALERVPFEWTQLEIDRFRIFVKIDKSNPQLEQLADAWLAKNDPRTQEEIDAEHAETEKLFVTGASAKNRGTTH